MVDDRRMKTVVLSGEKMEKYLRATEIIDWKTPAVLEQGVAMLKSAYDWLRDQGIRQWTAPISMETYQEWQYRKRIRN